MSGKHLRAALFFVILAIFAATATITLLGVIGQIQIVGNYLGALFTALILELVGAVIAMFRAARFFEDDLPSTHLASKGEPVARPLPYLSNRVMALDGAWKGEAHQAFGPDGKPFTAEVLLQFDAKSPNISAKGIFRFSDNGRLVDQKFDCAGGFLLDRFLRFEYDTSEKGAIQFGSIILELEPNATELRGRYQGYGVRTKDIVHGSLLVRKVV
jgi:hypothetical protein